MNTRTIQLNGAPVEVTRVDDDAWNAVCAEHAARLHDDPYRAAGYEGRADYLASLADDLEVDLDTVLMAADMLGPSEDFDGLVTALEDAAFEGFDF